MNSTDLGATELRKNLSVLTNTTDSVDKLFTGLIKSHDIAFVTGSLDQVEESKLLLLLAYSLNTLIYVYIKLEAMDPAEIGVMKEIERVKEYMSKLQRLEDRTKQRIDVNAAKRFISNSLRNSTGNTTSSKSSNTSANEPVSIDMDAVDKFISDSLK